jgi:two-component system chemotaxis response regulator CheY
MKIMIADDSMVMRKIISKIVETLGHEPVHATDGQQALDVISNIGDQIGLLLLDWNMPVLDGMGVLKTMKEYGLLQKLPVVMVTSENDSTDMNVALEAGAVSYITKPFTPEDLEAKIRDTMS